MCVCVLKEKKGCAINYGSWISPAGPMHVDVGVWGGPALGYSLLISVCDSPLSAEYRCLCMYLEKAGLEINFSLQHSTSLSFMF